MNKLMRLTTDFAFSKRWRF